MANRFGTVRLKLFNLLLAELGPLIIARGLILERDELEELLAHLPNRFDILPGSTGTFNLSATFRE